MQLKIGEKIKSLRKEKNISQEVLAQYLGVTFQAVSKWENGTALPDVTTIPAIALFFGVSTDQLFDIHLLEIEQQVSELWSEQSACQLSVCKDVIEAMAQDEAAPNREQTFYERYGRGVLEQIQTHAGQIPKPSTLS